MAEIGPNTRLKVSPFYQATIDDGVAAFVTYNRMLLPVSYGDPAGEYERLMTGVSQWDVGVQRQVQLKGPDAARLAQILSVRDLTRCRADQGRYVPMCDHRGTLINDPVVMKRADDLFWFSIADNNVLLWARGIAAERRLNVEITEPDVSPMAVQGPKAEDVIEAIFGSWVRDLKYFGFRETSIGDIPVVVARSGYSKQGGFELYLMDGQRGTELWNIVREAGKPWDIGPGYPNPTERIESGLLSFGGDTDDRTNPFEVRLGKFVDLNLDDEVIGIVNLRDIHRRGIERHQLGILLDGDEPRPVHAVWYDVLADGRKVGDMTNGTWSPRRGCTLGYTLISRDLQPGERVVVMKDGAGIPGTLCELPFC